jgi:hypothetical protein
MVPVSALETTWTTALATSTTAGLSVALKVQGVIIPFTPGEDMSSLSAGDLAVSTVLGGISVTAATRLALRDPANGDYKVVIQPPAGGFQEASGASGTYPVTVYGAILTKTPHAIPDDIIGSKVFPDPVTLTAPSQLLEYGDIDFSFSVGTWF